MKQNWVRGGENGFHFTKRETPIRKIKLIPYEYVVIHADLCMVYVISMQRKIQNITLVYSHHTGIYEKAWKC